MDLYGTPLGYLSINSPMNLQSIHPLAIPLPLVFSESKARTAAPNGLSVAFNAGDLLAARKARQEKKAEWSKLSLRQDWADAAFMCDHLRAAGLRSPDISEPATVTRLRCLLRRAGVDGPEIMACVGSTLAGYLLRNPSLPLWAALALVLESTGRFTRATV